MNLILPKKHKLKAPEGIRMLKEEKSKVLRVGLEKITSISKMPKRRTIGAFNAKNEGLMHQRIP